MVAGRPREWNREEIYLQLNEWCKKPGNLFINKFCSELDLDPQKLCDWAAEDEDFRVLYRIAKTHIACKREELANEEELPFSLYKMHARNYDHFINKEYLADKEMELSMRIRELEAQLKLKTIDETREPLYEKNEMMSTIIRQQAEIATLKANKFGTNDDC